MKTILPPESHSHTCRNIFRYSRRFSGICLTLAGVSLATLSLQAAILTAPIVGWIADQRLTSSTPGFKTQIFRMQNFAGATAANFMTAKKRISGATGWPNGIGINFDKCQSGDAGCPLDGTWWKIMFTGTPNTSGSAVVTVTATGTNQATGYTSFTLQVDKTVGATNPPSLATLPNYALQVNATSNQAIYTAQFAISDLDNDNSQDLDDIYANFLDNDPYPFTFTSSNSGLIDTSGMSLQLAPVSSDPVVAELQGPHSYILTATTKLGATGTATISMTLTDPNGNSTTTSFLLRVWALGDNPPTIDPDLASGAKTYLVYPTPGPSPQYRYLVASKDTSSPGEHFVSATSSNANLVPNDTTHLSCSTPNGNGQGTVTITPILPPAGIPQASTITLSVEDGEYVRQNSFLYVVSPAGGSAVTAYSRPTGVYPTTKGPLPNLSSDSFLNGSILNLDWGDADTLEAGNTTHDYKFSGIGDAIVEFAQQNSSLDLSLDLVGDACYIMDPTNLDHATLRWCDPVSQDNRSCTSLIPCTPPVTGSFERAVPWDSYLRTSRDAYFANMKTYLTGNSYLGKTYFDWIQVINTNVPGIETGIRQPGAAIRFKDPDFPDYTRPVFLSAIGEHLRAAVNTFSGKLIQVGFFEVKDDLGPTSGEGNGDYDNELWQWLYKDASEFDANGTPLKTDDNGRPLIALADEFNGVMRPRVSFFQETLAAARTPIPPALPAPSPTPSSNAPNYSTPPATTAYTFGPMSIPSFDYYGQPYPIEAYNNGIVFQSNTVWSDPFIPKDPTGDVKYTITVNGSPNDAMEAAFNSFNSQYLEVFPQDIDQAIPGPGVPQSLNAVTWAKQLQSWHDYAGSLRSQAPLEGPAGVNVNYLYSTQPQLNVKCYPVYGATSYSVDWMSLNSTPNTWTSAGICDPTLPTGCTVNVTAGTEYEVRVTAQNSGGSIKTYSYAALFLSEPLNDGYIRWRPTPSSYMNRPGDTPEPGILAGEPSGSALVHNKGFLSFHTGDLGPSTTVLGAKLRLRQATSGINFDPNKQCYVDIKKSYFGPFIGDSAALDGSDDFNDATQTSLKVFSIFDVGLGNWFEVNLTGAMAARNVNINTNVGGGVTQFRIYFDDNGQTIGRSEGWYSGNSTTYPPQLLVRYK